MATTSSRRSASICSGPEPSATARDRIQRAGRRAAISPRLAGTSTVGAHDAGLAERFASVADALAGQEAAILAEFDAVQGAAVDIGGYYNPDDEAATKAMRPSASLNKIIDSI